MRAGIAEYRKKDFEAARAAFARAWRLQPHSDIAAALADVEMKLGRYRDAAGHWDYYLNHHPPDRDEALAQLAECRKFVGRVQVDVRPREADVVVDGMRMSATEREGALWLDPGEHTIVARYDGRSSPEKKFRIAAGGEQAVRLEVSPPTPKAPVAVAAPLPSPSPPSSRRISKSDDEEGSGPRTIVLVGGAALAVGAVAVGIASVLRSNSADSGRVELLREIRADTPPTIPTSGMCFGPMVSEKCGELAQKANEKARAQNVATGAFIGGGVLAAATVALYLLWPAGEKNARAHGLVVGPLAERGGHGIQMRIEL